MTVAAHIANDLTKKGWSANTPDITSISCLANDYGWDEAFERWVNAQMDDNTTLVAISSSGQSSNIIKACIEHVNRVITFTGFSPDNPVRKLGHTNYYVPSDNYGIVECAHLAILHSIVNPGTIK